MLDFSQVKLIQFEPDHNAHMHEYKLYIAWLDQLERNQRFWDSYQLDLTPKDRIKVLNQ